MDKSHYRRNAKFLNKAKAKLKPIRARDVHVRHQIDLMDMSKKRIREDEWTFVQIRSNSD